MSKKPSGSSSKPGEEKPKVDFIDLTFVMSEENRVANYRNLIAEMRQRLGARGGTQNGPYLLPKADPKKPLYIRLRFVTPGEPLTFQCAVIIRAYDLYVVGYQRKDGTIYEMKPDNEMERIMDTKFSRSEKFEKTAVVKPLPLGGSYGALTSASMYKKKENVPLGYGNLKKAVEGLAVTSFIDKAERKKIALLDKGKGKKIAIIDKGKGQKTDASTGKNTDQGMKTIATSVLTLVIMISEATRMRNIEDHIALGFELTDSVRMLGDTFAKWVLEWGKVSDVIKGGTNGENETLIGLDLLLGENGENLSTVEQARQIIAIMPPN